MTPDLLTLRDVELQTFLGVGEAERSTRQRVLLSVEMPVDARAVAAGDDLSAGVDYAAVRDDLLSLQDTPRATLEKLAEDAAAVVLERHPLLPSVTIEARKFPFPGETSAVLRITRDRR